MLDAFLIVALCTLSGLIALITYKIGEWVGSTLRNRLRRKSKRHYMTRLQLDSFIVGGDFLK